MRKYTRLIIVLTLPLLLLGFASTALAFKALGGRWGGFPVNYYTTGVWNTATGNAVASWNNTGTRVNLQQVADPAAPIYIDNARYFGQTGWVGQTTLRPNPQANPYTRAIIYTNRTYMDGYVRDKRQSVIAHELGHGLGLDHPWWWQREQCVLMAQGAEWVYDHCGIIGPTPDEVNGINAIYP